MTLLMTVAPASYCLTVVHGLKIDGRGDLEPKQSVVNSPELERVAAKNIRGGPDALVALATYKKGNMPLTYVKTARMAGFNGQIILGVSPNIDDRQKGDLEKLGVTLKFVKEAPCQLPFEDKPIDYMLRSVCSAEFPNLKLESARFALARKWIEECQECTGWVLVSDYSDLVFQRQPFKDLGRPAGTELYFVEEYMGKNETDRKPSGRGIDNTYWFTSVGVKTCYGYELGHTPTLNSGSIVGAKGPMVKFLERLQAEFEMNVVRGAQCDPSKIADQATLNHLFYAGAFANLNPKTWKYGDGPITTIGIPCSGTGQRDHDHSATDIVRIENGLVLNNKNEPSNAVHQDKVCWENYVIPTVSRWSQTSIEEVVIKFALQALSQEES